MLLSLHIRNYILIDSLDIEFPEGLVIITGQTGAGKSILLGALSFLAGAKADASMISPGASTCTVEAGFDSSDARVAEMLAANDIEPDGTRLLIRRVISSSGRSRSFINDCPVQQGVLQSISSLLVDIHSQHKSLLLADSGFQLSVLDAFAGNSGLLADCRRSWKELLSLRAELGSLRAELAQLQAERDYNADQLARLTAAGLESGELEALEEEHRSLANAGQIKEALVSAVSAVSPEEDSAGVFELLKNAVRRLEQVSAWLPAVSGLASRLESARIEIDDICSELENLDSRLDVSPERLETVEERMSLLYSLMRRYSCSDVDGLIERRDSLAAKIDGTAALEERISELESREHSVREAWQSVCAALGKSRREAAPALSARIMESLRFLELEDSGFEIRVEPKEGGADGCDRAVFLFSSGGNAPRELSKVASGGEISRIMLCLKAIMARTAGMPTLIFDEIDTGVSGSVADRMGQMICSMGGDMQVFAITHLPQVAAKGDAHYVVSKSQSGDGRSVSTVRRVTGDDRVREVARLLSGSEITGAALQNAEVLLSEGR